MKTLDRKNMNMIEKILNIKLLIGWNNLNLYEHLFTNKIIITVFQPSNVLSSIIFSEHIIYIQKNIMCGSSGNR